MSRRHQKEVEAYTIRHRSNHVDEKVDELQRDANLMIERLRAKNIASRARDLKERLKKERNFPERLISFSLQLLDTHI